MSESNEIMVNILYEDKDIIVVEKPYGVSAQTERGSSQDMVSILMNYFREKGEAAPYVGVVHRLDKNVAGVMVYGKNKAAAGKLSSDISNNLMKKKYYAVCCDSGKLPLEGIMEDRLIKCGRENKSRLAEKDEPGGKWAKLKYTVVARECLNNINMLLADVRLITGRHHQIRVQFASRGCPLIGDRKYNTCREAWEYINHVALYCYGLSFNHPASGRHMEFKNMPGETIFKLSPK